MVSKDSKGKYDFFTELENLGRQNNIETEVVIDKVKSGMRKAVQRMYPECRECVRVDIDMEKRIFQVVLLQTVVEGEPADETEVSLDEARTQNPLTQPGDIYEKFLDISKFGRASAQSAKQSIKGDLRDISRDRVLDIFSGKVHDIITCTVTQVEPGTGSATLQYSGVELYLLQREMIPGEVLREGMSIKVYVSGITNTSKKPIIRLSRVHKDLLRRLFELEVPEIYDGTILVHSVAREPGARAKMAVSSTDPNVDAVGSCIGPKRARISAVTKELNGEKIDIIPYNESPEIFIASALSPAKVDRVQMLEPVAEYDKNGEPRLKPSAVAYVPADQLSLAIGNHGLNARLAARLTGCKIDIKPVGAPLTPVTPPPDEDEDIFTDAATT